MLKLMRFLVDRPQSGQVLVMGIAVLILSLGAIMISIDVGWWLRDKRDAQNDVDAIALAASQNLPDTVAAELAGEDWAVANGIDPSTELAPPPCPGPDLPAGNPWTLQGNFCFEDHNDDGSMDLVRAKVTRPSDSFIATALGVGTPTLSPTAAAATVYVRGACVMPWGIEGENDIANIYQLDTQALYVFQNKGDFVAGSSGNFGARSIYGEGASTYKNAILGNCTPGNNSCTSDPVVYVNETLLDCTSETGTKGAATANTLNQRFVEDPSPGPCDATTLAEAESRVDPTSAVYCPERLVPIAVIASFPPSGSSADVDIYGIVNFYLGGWSKNKTCFTFPDGSTRCGFVWGYLITSAPVSTAQAVFTRDFIPFAPTGVALVE